MLRPQYIKTHGPIQELYQNYDANLKTKLFAPVDSNITLGGVWPSLGSFTSTRKCPRSKSGMHHGLRRQFRNTYNTWRPQCHDR